MPTYFLGWRRKLGVVTLVMACVFVSGWMRSWGRSEECNLPLWPIGSLRLISEDGYFLCSPSVGPNESEFEFESFVNQLYQSSAEFVQEEASLSPSDPNSVLQARSLRVIVGWQPRQLSEGQIGNLIPYWQIVLPLTLLAAWLLLSKLRSKKSP